jgi:S-adenosylmethionine synthetase
MDNTFLFTSESVSEGHPDKVADQISDAILDAILAKDPEAKVAAETLVTDNFVILAGEIKSKFVDVQDNEFYKQVVRKTIENIGYNDDELGFSSKSCEILVKYIAQSQDISAKVEKENGEIGAGDQGLMFGYACNQEHTGDSLMPLPIYYAHRIMQQHALLRKNGKIKWLRPDAKTQLTVKYDSKTSLPISIETIVLSTQHQQGISQATIREAMIEEIIKPVIPAHLLAANWKDIINPGGSFVIGGPSGDCGLTGRKIIVDSYGGSAPHGGGAFSGKDPTKVDRSAAYMARFIAKNVVKSGLANVCQIQLAYAIGETDPVGVNVYTFGTGKIPDRQIQKLVLDTYGALRPREIIEKLNLRRPIYLKTAAFGHFGRNDKDFTWENTSEAYKLA